MSSQSERDGKAIKQQASPFEQEGFLYSVLNLPETASSEEVRERYRALSVLFHPDKQREESTKITASKRFLEIQKAYEVLSDPFLRTVYDIYGFEGTRMKWPLELRSRPVDELVKILNHSKWEHEATKMQSSIRSQGRLVIGIDASSLFRDRGHVKSAPLREYLRGFNTRFRETHISSFTLRHSFQKVFNTKTKVVLTTRAVSGRTGASNLLGTVKHQYSPRLTFEATAGLLRAHYLMIRARHHGEEGTCIVQTSLSPFEPVVPPITVTHARRLFKESMTQGVLICHIGHQPHFSINIVSPRRFGARSDPWDADGEETQLGSWTGFGTGVRQWSCGVTLADLGTSLKAEWGLVFPELSAQASLALQLSLAGPGWVATGSWGDEQAGVTTMIGLNAAGVELTLNISYIGQRLMLPIMLSENQDSTLACLAATIPSAVFMFAYHVILKPRRRKQRAEFYRLARKELLEERSNLQREIGEMTLLLRETARKHTHAEKIKEGLVVLEASYGPTDPDPEARDLVVDVTVAIQALVHKSQLYIPGHRSKSGLQGFYDPAPACAKSLRIRYTFGGRTHYCEVPDYKPVVLPLGDHLVKPVL